MSPTVNQQVSLDRQIETLVGEIHNLPTPPVVLTQINRVISDDRTSAYDIAAILAEDPAMSAQVLKISNSAFYGLANPVPTVKQAIIVLGMGEVRNLVLGAAVFTAFAGGSHDREYHENFWRHSLAVAVASRMLIRTHRVQQFLEAETAFSAGLLHDIGKIVVLCYAPAEHRKVRHLQTRRPMPDVAAETEVMGVNHTQIGAFLAQRWNLPREIVDTIAFHHRPQGAEDALLYPVVVDIANFLAHAAFDQRQETISCLPPESESMDRLGLDVTDFEGLKGRLLEEYAKSETFLCMALG